MTAIAANLLHARVWTGSVPGSPRELILSLLEDNHVS